MKEIVSRRRVDLPDQMRRKPRPVISTIRSADILVRLCGNVNPGGQECPRSEKSKAPQSVSI
jgi:hypothetical protein